MTARFLDNCLCGSFFYPLVFLYTLFLRFDFSLEIQPPTCWHKDKASSKCTMAMPSLGWIVSLWTQHIKCPSFLLCGRKRKVTEKYIWKRILAYIFYSLYFIGWFLWLLTLGHPVSSTLLYLGPTFYLPWLNQPKKLITQLGLVLPAQSSLSRIYLKCLPRTCTGWDDRG